MPDHDRQESFGALAARLTADPRVVGLILTGSQAREGTATEHSDHDVLVIVVDGAETKLVEESRRDAKLDVTIMPWTMFVDHARPGSPEEWDRYSFAHCRVVKDAMGGQVAALAEEKATLSASEAARIAPAVLDGFLNALYRSAKNARDRNVLAARLDAAESIGGYLTYVFALHRRVRPYNKYLAYELTRHPLSRPEWSAEKLLPAVEAVLGSDPTTAVRRLFADLEPAARAAGHGEVIDAWGADLTLMREAASPADRVEVT